MRPIKYRAWIKEGHPQNKNTMVEVLEIDFEEQEIFFKTKASENIIEMGGSDTGRWCTKFDRVEMLQFTGLTDRNGVDIYEGDIMTSKDIEMKNYSITGVVEWRNGCFWLIIDYRYFEHWEDITEGFENEVVGTKFENPGLLKGE